jgi:selT/selW/selH-like putative selenoprotein
MKRLVLIPSDGGRFEVSVDGKQVFSKLATGRFPEFAEIEKGTHT